MSEETRPQINENGVLRPMTEAEYIEYLIEKERRENLPTILSAEERIDNLESQIVALTEGYVKGVNQA